MAKEGGEASRKKRSGDWELPADEVDVDTSDVIGCGSTSQVYKGKYAGEAIAVKEIQDVDEGTIAAVRRELQVLTRAKSKHILKFFGMCSVNTPLRLCLEYCAGGTLFDLLHNRWDIPLSWHQRMTILMDTASAMAYLHGFRKQIIHRDLKSLNIFLLHAVNGEEDVPFVKIADFGFARLRDQPTTGNKDWPTMTRAAGSMHWMAPEVYKGDKYQESADIFSFSIVTYEVICRHMAFEDLDPESAGEQIASGHRPELNDDLVPEDTPEGLVELMQRCWSQEPSARPPFQDICKELQKIRENAGLKDLKSQA